MSDPFRTDSSRALEPVSEAERDARAAGITDPTADSNADQKEGDKKDAGKKDADKKDADKKHADKKHADKKIEQLLLGGLDHYFSARYEQAINVWTRALFFDRSHPRARAYIERARSALAERQRESEELVQNGLAAFGRGDTGTARRLLKTAIDQGAPTEEAMAALGRLDRLEQAQPGHAPVPSVPGTSAARVAAGSLDRSRLFLVAAVSVALVAATIVVIVTTASQRDWPSLLPLVPAAPAVQAAPPFIEATPELPRRGEMALDRARALAASGRLRDALEALGRVRPTDLERPDADRLRAEVQKQLLALAGVPIATTDRESSGLRLP